MFAQVVFPFRRGRQVQPVAVKRPVQRIVGLERAGGEGVGARLLGEERVFQPRRKRPGGLIAARRPSGVIVRPGGALDFKLVGGLGGDGKIRAGAQRVEKRRFGNGRADGVGDRGV